MPELKLARIPDRTPVKLTITVTPDLNQALQDYARLYAESYGREEPVAELVPAMLSAFLDSDRGFAKARSGKITVVPAEKPQTRNTRAAT